MLQQLGRNVVDRPPAPALVLAVVYGGNDMGPGWWVFIAHGPYLGWTLPGNL